MLYDTLRMNYLENFMQFVQFFMQKTRHLVTNKYINMLRKASHFFKYL